MTPSEKRRDAKLPTGVRLAVGAVAIVGLLLLATASTLEPDPRGYGTHEQLGLTPCYFQQQFDMVCPTCGTTTAWAHLMRGQIRQALAANAGGTMLAMLVVVVTPWLAAVAIAGRWLGMKPSMPLVLTVGASLLGVALLDWLRKWLVD